MEPNNLFRFMMARGKKDYVYPDFVERALQGAKNAPKFMLPEDAIILDTGLTALPSELRLPFKKIVIEYDSWENVDDLNWFRDDKIDEGIVSLVDGKVLERVLLIVEEKDDVIEIRKLGYIKAKNDMNDKIHMPAFAVLFPKCWTGNLKTLGDFLLDPDSGFNYNTDGMNKELREMHDSVEGQNVFQIVGKTIYINPVVSVLSLIEALSCSNVTHEALPVRKLNKGAAKRGALPFDEYRVLTITPNKKTVGGKIGLVNDRHSPREHLRRGHIRTYENGNKIWIQSMVVNAGIGQSLSKDYKVK